ncbi:MAG TPA: hypothetical protein VFF79_18860 [Conexibacter sp.]|nr:hypothetical protein [Conexibacter sp.]
MLTIDYTRATGRRYRTTSAAEIGDPVVTCQTYERTRLGRGLWRRVERGLVRGKPGREA